MVDGKKILRGTLGRFLPTSGLLMAVGLVPLILSRVQGLSSRAPLIALVEIASATLGYGTLLWLMRKRLSSDAPVAARPSVVAGAVAPLAMGLAIMMVPKPAALLSLGAASATAGALLAVAMFSPWLAKQRAASTLALEVPGASDPSALPPSPIGGSTSHTYARSHVRLDDSNERE